MLSRIFTTGVVLVLFGCTVGGSVKKLPPITTGGGIAVDITLVEVQSWPGGLPTRTPFQRVTGELLAADDMGLLVNGPAIGHFAYSVIRSAEFPGLSKFDLSGAGLSADKLAELKLYSRYPTSIDADITAALLDGYGQDSLYVFR